LAQAVVVAGLEPQVALASQFAVGMAVHQLFSSWSGNNG
jgi:hypothetical protein